jgi:hypothetical protein
LLPKLAPAAPSDFHLTGLPVAPSTALGFPFPFSFGPATPQSCWVDETAAQGAHRCLRLTNQIDNVGDGPLILRFRLLEPLVNPGVDPQKEYLTGCEMQQVIERDDGTSITRDAGPCVFHIPHGHFHYQNMATFALYGVTAGGATGALVRSSTKQGFCLTDVAGAGYGTPGLDARHYWFPNCNLPSQVDSNLWVRMGVDPGWGDVYTWDVPAQYIEISGVPDGIYDVVSVANPLGQIAETGGHRSGTARTRICLTATTVAQVASSATNCTTHAASVSPPGQGGGGGRSTTPALPSASVAALPMTAATASPGVTITSIGIAFGLVFVAARGSRRRRRAGHH